MVFSESAQRRKPAIKSLRPGYSAGEERYWRNITAVLGFIPQIIVLGGMDLLEEDVWHSPM